MSDLLNSISRWTAGILVAHPWIVLVVLVPTALWFLATIVAACTRKQTSADWALYCVEHPVRATLIRFCRAFGLYAIKILQLRFPDARPLPEVRVQIVDPLKRRPRVPPLPLLVIVLALLGCAKWTPQHTADVVHLSADQTDCMVQRWAADPDHFDFGASAMACGIANVSDWKDVFMDIVSLFSSQQKARAKMKAAVCSSASVKP